MSLKRLAFLHKLYFVGFRLLWSTFLARRNECNGRIVEQSKHAKKCNEGIRVASIVAVKHARENACFLYLKKMHIFHYSARQKKRLQNCTFNGTAGNQWCQMIVWLHAAESYLHNCRHSKHNEQNEIKQKGDGERCVAYDSAANIVQIACSFSHVIFGRFNQLTADVCQVSSSAFYLLFK